MIDYLEIQFWRIAKYLIRKGYGADEIGCGTEGNDEPDCASCRASHIIKWIDNHIELIKK
jgi:hypothetical protein